MCLPECLKAVTLGAAAVTVPRRADFPFDPDLNNSPLITVVKALFDQNDWFM